MLLPLGASEGPRGSCGFLCLGADSVAGLRPWTSLMPLATCLPSDTAQCLLQTLPALDYFCFIFSYAKTVKERSQGSQGFAQAQQALRLEPSP